MEYFSKLPDPHDEKNRLCPFEEILLLCVSAVVSGPEGWEAIERFGQAKLEWLRRFVRMRHGIPSHDNIAWVMARLSPKRFQACFVDWMQSLAQVTQGEIIGSDGKTSRRSHDKKRSLGAIHMVSAWASKNQVSLGQAATDAKSHEIAAIPALLDLLAIKGGVVTIDAMGCQTAIAEKIVDQQADYMLAFKGNQCTLYDAIEDYFTTAKAHAFAAVPMEFTEDTADTGWSPTSRRYPTPTLETTQRHRDGGMYSPTRRSGLCRPSLLHLEFPSRCPPLRPNGAVSLGRGKQAPLGLGCDLSRG